MGKRMNLSERRDGVIGTARWIAAMASSARAEGRSDVTIKIVDLCELTGFIAAVERLEIKNSSTIHLGYCRSDKVREILAGERTMVSTISRKSDVYDTEVFIGRLPKLSAVESGPK